MLFFLFSLSPHGVVVMINPILNVKKDSASGIMIKVAQGAIQKYNEKENNVFKYAILKIDKANCMTLVYEKYLIMVKVLNLTLDTLIEFFYTGVARRILLHFEAVLSCNPKGVELHLKLY